MISSLIFALAIAATPGSEHVRIKRSRSTGPTETYALLKADEGTVRLERSEGAKLITRKTLNTQTFEHLVSKYAKGVVQGVAADASEDKALKCREPATIEWRLAAGTANPEAGMRKVCLDRQSGSGVRALIEVFHSMTLSQ